MDDTVSLKDLVAELDDRDVSHRVFGSEKHLYRLGPVLSEDDVAAFESRHSIRLPEAYRRFLTETGNGGAGPHYGLSPLGDHEERDLARPFPFTTPTADLPAEEVERHGYWEDFPGILSIGEQGSGITNYLVVNGPAYGAVWHGREDFGPTGHDFEGWYRDWAERALRALDNEKLLPKFRTGMTAADVRTEIGGDWTVRPSSVRKVRFMEASDMPAQLELDDRDVVIAVNPRSFI